MLEISLAGGNGSRTTCFPVGHNMASDLQAASVERYGIRGDEGSGDGDMRESPKFGGKAIEISQFRPRTKSPKENNKKPWKHFSVLR